MTQLKHPQIRYGNGRLDGYDDNAKCLQYSPKVQDMMYLCGYAYGWNERERETNNANKYIDGYNLGYNQVGPESRVNPKINEDTLYAYAKHNNAAYMNGLNDGYYDFVYGNPYNPEDKWDDDFWDREVH